MPLWGTDATSIMPLMVTRGEIDATYALLKQLEQTWLELFATVSIDIGAIRRIILVGSGDSWSAALTAAAWIESNSVLYCASYQTFTFLHTDIHHYGSETLIVVISASGRLSPVTEALKYALTTNAQVLGITNGGGMPFSALTGNMLFSGAQKKGMPTQSTSATLYLLLRLVDVITGSSPFPDYFLDSCDDEFRRIRQNWLQKERGGYRQNRLTFLGNRLTWGIALAGSNLLSCGPQIHADAFPVEEFSHSLRLNQVALGERFILLPGCQAEREFYITLRSELLKKGAVIDIIDIQPTVAPVNQLFHMLQYLYEMSWHLSVDFVEQGGQRVCYQERE